jgi:hypothetical protein
MLNLRTSSGYSSRCEMNGLTATGIVLAGFGALLLVWTILMMTFVTSPLSIAGGTFSICIMMVVGGIVLIIFGGKEG